MWPTSDELAGASGIIGELDRVDPGSMSFRYPTDRHGDLAIPRDLQNFNLHHFGEAIDKLAMVLDGASTGLYVELDWRSEQPEYARENAERSASIGARRWTQESWWCARRDSNPRPSDP